MDGRIKEAFEEYLLSRGYSENALRGGVRESIKRIDRVCDWEKITWEELKEEVGRILWKYGGEDKRFARNSVVLALKRFEEFTNEVLP